MADAILDGKEQRDEMRSRTAPVCYRCLNWETGTDICTAFPIGIPDEIFIHGNPHASAFADDGGIRFEPIPKEPTP